MNYYKYIHLFFLNELTFSSACVRNINDKENEFVVSEHLFVTPYENVYNVISKYGNAEFAECKNNIELINKYAPMCDYIIAHSLPQKEYLINPRYYNKIIWRTWGHDVQRYNSRGSSVIKNLAKLFLCMLWKHQVRSFRAVGVFNTVDRMDIREHFGDVTMFRFPYTAKEESIIIGSVIPKVSTRAKKILLGHSGFPNDNHVEILKKLKKFSREEIEIYMVLSYGNEDYINEVRGFVEKWRMQNVKIIDEFMQYDEYVEFLSGIDIAILDNDKSYALGNIAWLLHLKKKIFLNRNGVIKRAFDADGVPCVCTDEIDGMTFGEFVEPLNFDDVDTEMVAHGYEYDMNDLKKLFCELESK